MKKIFKKFEDLRWHILEYLKKMFNIAEGQIMPLWLRFFCYMLFPSTIMWAVFAKHVYDIQTDCFIMEGYIVSRHALYSLLLRGDCPTPWSRVVERNKKTKLITIESRESL
jgi:hypothetical protein